MVHFAVVDAARDPAITTLLATAPETACLFSGPLPPVLAAAAPWLVSLEAPSAFRDRFEGAGWQRGWGIVCAADATTAAVRKQLRQFLLASLPDGTAVLFRFYDPRVFVPFMEAAEPPALDAWFGPVTDYWSPAPDGGTLHLRRGEGGVLRTRRRP
mgnify:CR=1 FL=1